jgi:hypothetical protein
VDRRLLPDCCEDWILDWGARYPEGKHFSCLECGRAWTKQADDTFQDEGGAVYHRVEARGFPSLAAAEGAAPLLNRCCLKILIEYGPKMTKVEEFECPVCDTRWRKQSDPRSFPAGSGDSYVNVETGHRFRRESGRTRAFLHLLEPLPSA